MARHSAVAAALLLVGCAAVACAQRVTFEAGSYLVRTPVDAAACLMRRTRL